MKSLFLFIIVCFTHYYTSVAQITITLEDLGSSGTSLHRTLDNNPNSAIIPGSSGEDLTWDFSSIESENFDTIKFIEVSETPYVNEFPTSDLCIRLGTDIEYAFLSVSDDIVKVQGISKFLEQINDDVLVKFSPEQINMVFPATYGTSVPDNYGFTVVRHYGQTVTVPGIPFPVMVDSVKIINTTEATMDFDAWGTVTTPYGDLPSIRSKRVDFIENELYAKSNSFGSWIDVTSLLEGASSDTIAIYSWWAKDVGYPVFEILVDYNTNEIKRASCIKTQGSSSIKEANNSLNFFEVYPNPAKDFLNIKTNYTQNAVFKVYDLTGSFVFQKKINKFTKTINLNNLPNNLYFYTIIGEDKIIKKGKLFIEK